MSIPSVLFCKLKSGAGSIYMHPEWRNIISLSVLWFSVGCWWLSIVDRDAWRYSRTAMHLRWVDFSLCWNYGAFFVLFKTVGYLMDNMKPTQILWYVTIETWECTCTSTWKALLWKCCNLKALPSEKHLYLQPETHSLNTGFCTVPRFYD